MRKKRILIAAYPFAETGSKPLDLLKETGWELVFNPYKRRLKEGEVGELLKDIDAVIAGTEPYTIDTLQNSSLKVICRVGIGLDNVPLNYCKQNQIAVTYTPDAPSQAVAELTVANIINLARQIETSNQAIRKNDWYRYMGLLISELNIGLLGIGRIGKRVVKLLQPFNPKILAHDLRPDLEFGKQYNLTWLSKEELLHKSDIVSLHIPYYVDTHYFINANTLAQMKKGSALVNTARGKIVCEKDVIQALKSKHLSSVALDVFEKEPYEGELQTFDNVILTAHIAASAKGSRYLMELGAVEDCIRVLNNATPENDAIKETELYYPLD